MRRFRNSSTGTARMITPLIIASRPRGYDEEVNLTIDLDREEDARWIAEALDIPGVMCYGETRNEAISNVERAKAVESNGWRIALGSS